VGTHVGEEDGTPMVGDGEGAKVVDGESEGTSDGIDDGPPVGEGVMVGRNEPAVVGELDGTAEGVTNEKSNPSCPWDALLSFSKAPLASKTATAMAIATTTIPQHPAYRAIRLFFPTASWE
jgi:hypothetical protein